MSQKILSSWKEIASYLGHSQRTVQRWEKELKLPIHRPAGRESHSVMAFASQLDDWMQSLTQNSATSSSGRASCETELPTSFSSHAMLTKLERLLLEEDALFQQLQEKRSEIRREKAQKQNGSEIESTQNHAAVMSRDAPSDAI